MGSGKPGPFFRPVETYKKENEMDSFINEDAKLAVKKGIYWLDSNHPGWADLINLDQLDMGECQDCVIGQAVGDYSRITREAIGGENNYMKAAAWAVEHGFESPSAQTSNNPDMYPGSYGYQDLDTLWSDEVRRRLG